MSSVSSSLPGPELGAAEVDAVLEQLPLGWFHWRLLLVCGMSFIADAMEISLLSFISICAGDDWNLSDAQVASISSCVFVGMLVGNAFWGPFADKYGRRGAFLLGSSIIIIFGIGTGLSPNFITLVVMRSFLGFGIGGCTISFDILAEFLPTQARGSFLTNINYFWTVGSMIVAGFAWLFLSDHGWEVLALVTAFPVAISLTWAMFVLPESPRWLVLKGRLDEAELVIIEAARVNGTDLPPFRLSRALSPDTGSENVALTRTRNWSRDAVYVPVGNSSVEKAKQIDPQLSDYCSYDLLKIAVPLWMIWFLFGLTYYGIILLTSRVYEKDSDSDSDEFVCDFSYPEIFMSASSEVVGIALTSAVIDRWGRRGSQASLYCLAGCGVLFMGLQKILKMSGLLFTFWALFARITSMAATSVTMVITPELFSTKMRASGHSIGSSFSRVGGFATPFLVNSSKSILFVSSVLAIGNFVAMLCSCMLPETKGVALDHAYQRVPVKEPLLSRDYVPTEANSTTT